MSESDENDYYIKHLIEELRHEEVLYKDDPSALKRLKTLHSQFMNKVGPNLFWKFLRDAEKGKPIPDFLTTIYRDDAIRQLERTGALKKDDARILLYAGVPMPDTFYRYVADVLGDNAKWTKTKRGTKPNANEVNVISEILDYLDPAKEISGFKSDAEFIAKTAEKFNVSEDYIRERLYPRKKRSDS